MATSTADPAPLARAAVRRYYPRQEPSAVVPHAGICAGGGRQRPSLPQPDLTTRRGEARSDQHEVADRARSLELDLNADVRVSPRTDGELRLPALASWCRRY